jgi:hypothetical protein
MKNMIKYKSLTACLVVLLAVTAFAEQSTRAPRPGTALTRDFSTYIDANKILMFVTNKGSFAFDNGSLLGKSDGLYYPYTGIANIENGSNKTSVIYAASVWMGAMVANTLDASYSVGDTLVTSGQHNTDWGEGPLVYNADSGWSLPVPGATTAPPYRVYTLYADSLADNPNTDYLEWPVDQGAPVNEDGTPKLPGGGPAQAFWSVYNDLDVAAHAGEAGTTTGKGIGLGVEVRQMMWAYESEGALANMVFARFRIYNKGPHDLENMYVSLWADPDLGDASDDLVGCDTVLSLGYCYNAQALDTDYGSRPPATGYDFFQGPMIATGNDADTAIMWDFQKFPGFTNMGMTSYNKYVNPYGPDDATDSYEFMTGLQKDGTPLVFNGDTTKYFGWGDPVAGTGFLDADPADRRWMQSTGPFSLARGDSTEIVAAIIVAQGTDYLNSITELKLIDEFAQQAYDKEFQLPLPPKAPVIEVTPLDGRIVLTWGDDSEVNSGAYPFEGYTLVQGESQGGPWTDTLGWYDIKNGMGVVVDVRFDTQTGEDVRWAKKPGTDLGLEHTFSTTRDNVGGGNLINYQTYYYKLEAYSVNLDAPKGERTLTSASIVTAKPEPPLVGTNLRSVIGDTLVVTHTTIGGADPSPGFATVRVVNPAELTGDAYKIAFTTFFVRLLIDDLVDPPDTTWDTVNGTVWHVINTSTGDTVVNNWVNQSGVLGNDYPVADGLLFEVSGPAFGINSFQCVANGAGVLDPIEPGAADFANFPTPPGLDGDGRVDDRQQVGDGHWFFHTGGDYGDIDEWIERTFRGDANRLANLGGYDWEMRFTGENSNPGVGGGYAWAAFTSGNAFWVPFELWRIGISTPDDPSDDVRLIPWIFDDGGDSLYYMSSWGGDPNCGPGGCESPISGGDNDPYTDWVYWKVPLDETPGTAGYDVFEAAMIADPQNWPGDEHAVMDRTVLVNWNGDTTATATGGATVPSGYNQDLPELGTVFRLITEKPNMPTDEFVFTTANLNPSVATSGAESLLDMVKAVPNPYYLFSSYDASVFNREMKFINLPAECTITIYNLGGDRVRQLEKNDNSTELTWNVLNHASIPVASGIYIYVVESEGFGQKIGKMAIFTETEQLNQF